MFYFLSVLFIIKVCKNAVFSVPEFVPDIIKKQYDKIIVNIYRIQSNNSNECGKFSIMFIKANIQNESDYIKFLLQFHKNNFQKNDI